MNVIIFFFFQAEDGIRDIGVDWSSDVCSSDLELHHLLWPADLQSGTAPPGGDDAAETFRDADALGKRAAAPLRHLRRHRGRSEERRVGKGVDLGGRRLIKKKINSAA